MRPVLPQVSVFPFVNGTTPLNPSFQRLWAQIWGQSSGTDGPSLTYVPEKTMSKDVGVGTTGINRQGHWVQTLPQQDLGELPGAARAT